MNKTIDKLWELIHALSVSEKRYFKVYANKYGTTNKNNYIRLFDIINKQKTYDDEAVRVYFEGAVFLKQLHVTKHYLYQLILKSLRSFHAEKSVDSKIFAYFQDIELLFNKGLINQCKREINKAKVYIESQEKYLDLFRLTQWENEVDNELNKHACNKRLAASLKKDQDLLKQVVNLSEYIYLDKKMRNSLWVKGFLSDDWLRKMKGYLEHPLLNNIEQAHSFRAKTIYYEIHSMYNGVIGNWIEMEKNSRLGLELLETKPKFIKNNVHYYLKLLTKYCQGVIDNANKVDQFFKILNRLRDLPTNEKPIQLKAKMIYYNCLVRFQMNSGNEKELINLNQEIEAYLENTPLLKDEYKLLLISIVSDSYFIIGNYEKTLDLSNKLLDLKGFNLHHNIECVVRLRLLIIYIELEYFDLLEYSTRSLYRFLAKNEHVYEVETIFLRFIQNELIQCVLTRDLRKKCIKFLAFLKSNFDEKAYRRIPLEVMWLESKNKDITVAEILKQRYLSKALELKSG